MTDFQLIYDFVEESNSTNSNTDKINVLKKYTKYNIVKKALQYTYDTYKQYGVTSKNCKKRSDLLGNTNTYVDFFNLLDDLNNRVITGHSAIESVNRYVQENKDFEDIIWSIIDRNLKTRSTASMINKVVPGLIPTFDVALADTYNDKTKKKVNWNDGWYVSRKLDGVRCICIVDENSNATFFSRAGKEFKTLSKVKEVIKESGVKNIIFDGEVCILDKNGDEDFQSIIKEIKRKNHSINSPKFIAFDMLTIEEFESGVSERTLEARQSELNMIISHSIVNKKEFGDYLSMIQQTLINSFKEVEERLLEANKNGWEGLMIRKNTTYKGKRSSDILKVKTMYDAEYSVIDVENSINRVIVNGKEIEELMLKNVIIEHKGNTVQVGSGFSQEQRRHYFKNPNEIIGKQICVQFFEESKNQNGEYSLRFPVIKAVYETNRDI
jgi:DNA ligase 1